MSRGWCPSDRQESLLRVLKTVEWINTNDLAAKAEMDEDYVRRTLKRLLDHRVVRVIRAKKKSECDMWRVKEVYVFHLQSAWVRPGIIQEEAA